MAGRRNAMLVSSVDGNLEVFLFALEAKLL